MPAEVFVSSSLGIRPIRALLVEDTDLDVQALVRIMKRSRFAFDVHRCKDGQEAWEHLLALPVTDTLFPDVALLDLNMPRMDGREFLEAIRGSDRPEIRALPVVVLTTSRSEEDVVQAWDLGVAGYMVKPGTADGLRNVVELVGGWFTGVLLRGETGVLLRGDV